MCMCAQSEDIVLDPDLNHACSIDVERHCQGVKHGRAQVCFREHHYILYSRFLLLMYSGNCVLAEFQGFFISKPKNGSYGILVCTQALKKILHRQ